MQNNTIYTGEYGEYRRQGAASQRLSCEPLSFILSVGHCHNVPCCPGALRLGTVAVRGSSGQQRRPAGRRRAGSGGQRAGSGGQRTGSAQQRAAAAGCGQ
eukprot:gene8439-biopygen89